MTVVYICHDCMSYNKHHRGEPGFEYREYEIADSLSLAIEHIKEGHTVYTEVRNYEDEE